MKKLLSVLLDLLCVVAANAAQIANVEYVHKMIEHKWDISVPYNPNLSYVRKIANMKYLLTAIDVANEILNGEPTTDYGNGEFATLQVADTVATYEQVGACYYGDTGLSDYDNMSRNWTYWDI